MITNIITGVIRGFYFINILSSSIYVCCSIKHYNDIWNYPRIVGGFPAKPGQFQYQAYITILTHYGIFNCGGVIVSEFHVITAAHCVIFQEKIPAANFIIEAGDVNLNSKTMRQFKVEKVFVHGRYNEQTKHDYDIAILKLVSPFPLCRRKDDTRIGMTAVVCSTGFKAIEIAERSVPINTQCVVSGWGHHSSNNIIPVPPNIQAQLHYTNVYIMNKTECAKQYAFYIPISSRMICAQFVGKPKDACQGDSGGPLVCGNKLVGTVSWGIGCAKLPGVYANIPRLRDWILSVLDEGKYTSTDYEMSDYLIYVFG